MAALVGLMAMVAPTSIAQAQPTQSPSVVHALIEGSGSSLAANALNVWTAAVVQNGLQANYTASGSAQGRADFGDDITDFGVTDLPYQGFDPQTGNSDLPCKLGDTSDCRSFAYAPAAATAVTFPYHLTVGGQLVKNLRLSATTLAKIFTGHITRWNDPAITADNNGRLLPDVPIIPVVHSEGSAASLLVTTYFSHRAPAVWTAGTSQYFPTLTGQVAQTGSDGVMNYIASDAANGAVGYDEYPYALGKNYPVADVENAGGYYQPPTALNVAVALTSVKVNIDSSSLDYLTADFTGAMDSKDARAYPLSSYSYWLIPTSASDARMTTAKRQTLAEYLDYGACVGQNMIGPVGYAPLPLNLIQQDFAQLAALKQADPRVDLTGLDLAHCGNLTLDPNNPGTSQLNTIAPQPQACARTGSGPCPTAGSAANLALNPMPATVTPHATVNMSGTAEPGTTVNVYFHGLGERGYSLRRILLVGKNGHFSTSYYASRDERYYLTDAGSFGRPSGLTQITPTITSPATTYAGLNDVVTVQGLAGLGATVTLHYHRADKPAADYSIIRTVPVTSTGAWSRKFTLNTDYRVYASVGTNRSPSVGFTVH